MHLLFALLIALACQADDKVVIEVETPVYKTTAPGARVLFYLHPGDSAATSPANNPNYVKVRGKLNGKPYVGFLQRGDLISEDLRETMAGADSTWGFGGGGQYISLLQKGKSFTTDDQVQYTTTDYTSNSVAPFLAVQMNAFNFWRLTIAQKKTHFVGSAKTNVANASKDVDLQQTFYSLLLQKAWLVPGSKRFYFGVGAEAAKATAVALILGGVTLPTGSQELPFYLNVLVFGGRTFPLNPSLSLYGEARLGYIANQSPGILDMEVVAGLMYWPGHSEISK